jgi:prolyl 4-hydroxylase
MAAIAEKALPEAEGPAQPTVRTIKQSKSVMYSEPFSTTSFLTVSVAIALVSTLLTLVLQSYLNLQPTGHVRQPAWTSVESYLAGYTCKHGYSIKVLKQDPLVVLIDNFLQEGEGDYIRNISKPRMKRSSVAETTDNYYAVSNVRTSSSAFMGKSEDAVVKCVEERASRITNIPIEDCESLQVVWYTKGQKYEPHFDYFPRKDLVDYWSKKSGQRYVTILAYINGREEVPQGGHTGFPRLGLNVEPRRNSAVLWYNADSKDAEDRRTLHGGMPVEEGEKWAINIWQRKKIPGWDSGVSIPNADNAYDD